VRAVKAGIVRALEFRRGDAMLSGTRNGAKAGGDHTRLATDFCLRIREHRYGRPLLGAVRLVGHTRSGRLPTLPIDPDHAPGEAARETGIYEVLTMIGSSSRTREHIKAGAPLPAAPRGWTWRLVRQGSATGDVD